MKKLIFLFLLVSYFSFGQNKSQKWQFNAGMSGQIFRSPIDIPENLGKFEQLNMGFPLNYLSVSRHLFGGLSPELKVSGNKISTNPVDSIQKTLMANAIINLKYSLANGYILGEKSFIEPYLKGGGGMTYFDQSGDKFLPTLTMGGGLAFWINPSKNLGIQLQQLYHVVPSVQYNAKDYFDYSASLAYKFGMKDKDRDGTPDDKDECPENPGPKGMKGCPDKDQDGLADKKDRCPDDAGPLYLEGCPDRDGDSIADMDDKCPDNPGPKIFAGCPDKDNDSVPDYIDSCPSVKGLKQFAGCPDKDNDGIQDKYDLCPDVFGVARFKGCPDTDNDTIPDSEDKCPNEWGLRANNGCPDTTKIAEVDSTLAFSARSIFFNVNKYNILPASYPMLNEIAKTIKQNPGSQFVIEGHTDITGTEEDNLDLSRNRANAVKEYLISRGIGREILGADGFGQKYPIADNRNALGRAKNRRVDITVKR